MQFFQKFPRIGYYTTESIGGQTQLINRQIPNMTVKLQLDVLAETGGVAYETYRIEDGERPDTIAAKMYGNARYAWVVMLANKFRDWYDWPMNDTEFLNYLNAKYETTSGANDGFAASLVSVYQYVWITEDARELVVDETTYDDLAPESRRLITHYDMEYAENDAKRSIKLVSLATLPEVIKQLEEVLAK